MTTISLEIVVQHIATQVAMLWCLDDIDFPYLENSNLEHDHI